MPTSFHALIPELKVENGHHYPYHKKIQEAIEDQGVKYFAYVNDRCTIDPLPSFWKKWFRRKKEPHYHVRYLFKLFVDFSKIFLFEEKTSSRRIFFYESFPTGDLIAFSLAAWLFGKNKDVLWVLFRFERDEKEMKLQTWLMKQLHKKLNIKVLTDSELLIPLWEERMKQPVPLLINPNCLPEPVLTSGKKDKVLCSWLGGPRPEKGLKVIERLIQIQDTESKRFILSVCERSPHFSIQNQLTLQRRAKNLTWSKYVESLYEADVILLPYDPQYYEKRTSGVLIEAVVAGKIPIVTKGTWLASELKKYDLDELITDWEDPQFFSSLHHLLNEGAFLPRLQRLRLEYLQKYSYGSLKANIQSLL